MHCFVFLPIAQVLSHLGIEKPIQSPTSEISSALFGDAKKERK